MNVNTAPQAKGPWKEIYEGGSPEEENKIFTALAWGMLGIQEANRAKQDATVRTRTLHAKIVAGFTTARLDVDADLPPEFAVAYFQPRARRTVTLRLSNASGVPMPDGKPDMRGAAVRVLQADGSFHDLLMTSFPVSHARNARQFVEFAMIAASDPGKMMERLREKFGAEETARMAANLKQGIRPCASLALERYWSRGAVLWGDQPVRFQLRPASDAPAAGALSPDDADGLRTELASRLDRGDVRFRLALQRFVDEETTPIEDGAVEWREEVSPPVEVATLVIPRQTADLPSMALQTEEVDALAFNPWNAPAPFRPLGNLNRARNVVYRMSAEKWLANTPR